VGRPVAIRQVIIELNMQNLVVLRDALFCYEKYLKDVITFDHDIPLSEGAIKRRIKYIEDFIDSLELAGE